MQIFDDVVDVYHNFRLQEAKAYIFEFGVLVRYQVLVGENFSRIVHILFFVSIWNLGSLLYIDYTIFFISEYY